MRIAVAAAAVTLIAKVHCQVAVVEGTITESRSPSEGPAARAFFQAVANCLSGYGLPVTKLSDEDVAAGRLKGHAIAVFPYSAVWSSEEADALLSFVRDGGKVLVFYTAPSQVYRALGADEVTLIRAAYDGQLAEMRR
ncbi:MAG: hypothetical protein H5T86_11285, partial [Armatimonadetes bacterium]|nr:hypothetical protein [Armatimonadota bacterium]